MKHVTLLRGINVCGKCKVPMKECVAAFEELGYENVRHYIQSGNIVFDAQESDPNEMINTIENKLVESFGFEISAAVRTADQWKDILERNPFLADKNLPFNHLMTVFFRTAPQISDPSVLDNYCKLGEQYHLYLRIIRKAWANRS